MAEKLNGAKEKGKKVGETRAQRRRKVELRLLSGLGVAEISKALGYHEETIGKDIEYLQSTWAKRPEAKRSYEKRIATLSALSEYWLRQSQDESNPPNTRLSWAQGWMKLSDELASLTGVAAYAKEQLPKEKSLLEKMQGIFALGDAERAYIGLLEALLKEHGVGNEELEELKRQADSSYTIPAQGESGGAKPREV